MSVRRASSFAVITVAAIVIATVTGGVFGDRLLGSSLDVGLDKRLAEYTELLEAAKYWAPEEIGSEKLVYSSIDGMLRTLDPHSSFLEPRDYSDMQERQKGTFYGLGILVTKRNNQVTVITPLEGTPAYRLGIRAGDIISAVEGEPTEDLQLDEVVRRLKGAKGTPVNISIIRPGIEEPIPLTIIREAIPTNSITNALMIRPGVGYIRIKDFTYTTVRELGEAIDRLEGEGMEKLILDLRMNPGGLLDAAVGVSDFFVDKGQMIVYHKGRLPDSYQEYRAPGKQKRVDVPLVILINRESASASEIVAGAIQDHDRGLIVGQTSWGKGLVQSVYALQYGAGLALTTSRYFTPSGRNIQRDYSSFYDYYLGAHNGDQESQNGPTYSTDLDRKVYGGGGIAPDIVVEPRTLPPVIQVLQIRSAIFNYAVRYIADHDVTMDLEVGDDLIADFAAYAAANDIAPADEIQEVLKNDDDRAYVRRQLKAEIISARFGYEASYAARLEGDEQVAKALEVLPDARTLAARALDRRSESLASRDDAAGSDTARNQ